MYKTVYDLTPEELDELKEAYAVQLQEDSGISYGELVEAHNIPDDVIFHHYADIQFTDDDFFCNQKED